jgi:transposase
MDESCLLALPEGMLIEQIQITENGVIVVVVATSPTSCCPLCSQASSSIHCHYRRTLRDVPCAGRRVQLFLTVRKFSCRNPYCSRKVFAERLPAFVEPWARMTIRYCQQITSIGLSTCGKGGAKLATRLGIQTSRQTILRQIMELPDPPTGSVLHLGIDEFAFRRGYQFGTVLVDLESHRVVDLLPDRTCDSAAHWIWQHPDITVVSRDRGAEYAAAAALGASQAIQIADRFHVAKNLSEAVQRLLARVLQAMKETSQGSKEAEQRSTERLLPIEEWRPAQEESVKQIIATRRAERQGRYQHVTALREQGLTSHEIAALLGMKERTVRDWLHKGIAPDTRPRRKHRSDFDPYAPYVLKRWREGEHSGRQLWHEVRFQGYTGSERMVHALPGNAQKPGNSALSRPSTPAPLHLTNSRVAFHARPEKTREQ